MNKHGVITAAAAAIVVASLTMTLAGCGQLGRKPAASAAPRFRPAAKTNVARATSPRPATPTGAPAALPPQPATTPAAAQPAGVDTSIEVYANCTSPSFEPAQIRVSCADGGWVLENLAWTRWTTASATATGTLVYNDCTPSCSEEHFQPGAALDLLLGGLGKLR